MSFSILLYRNNSDKIQLDKDLTLIDSFDGDIKEETSIINPTLLLNATLEIISAGNYLYVPVFNRYYFIRDIVSVRHNMVSVDAHVDVLSSFKTDIRSNKAIINRAENNWNLYINDGSMKVYADSIVITKKFPSGFTTQNYVMAIASPDSGGENE